VTITSPAAGASLDAMDENKLVYEVDPGPRGDHVHVYVDGKEVASAQAQGQLYAANPVVRQARHLRQGSEQGPRASRRSSSASRFRSNKPWGRKTSPMR